MAALIPGLGVQELAIILVIVLVLFGPKRLPALGKSIGKTMKAIRDGVDGKDEEDTDEAEDKTSKSKSDDEDDE